MKIDKFEIKPHEFRHKIEIQRCIPGVDEDNIPTDGIWEPLLITRAKILTTKSDEETNMQGISGVVIKTFYIRASRQEITKRDRLVYNEVIYNIKSIDNIQERCIYVVIKAENVT